MNIIHENNKKEINQENQNRTCHECDICSGTTDLNEYGFYYGRLTNKLVKRRPEDGYSYTVYNYMIESTPFTGKLCNDCLLKENKKKIKFNIIKIAVCIPIFIMVVALKSDILMIIGFLTFWAAVFSIYDLIKRKFFPNKEMDEKGDKLLIDKYRKRFEGKLHDTFLTHRDYKNLEKSGFVSNMDYRLY